MAGQAGWYRAPGEEGLLRYWDGAVWTAHRQPDPAAAAPQRPVAEADPMAEYERQFDTPSMSREAFDSAASVPQPQYRPQTFVAPASSPAASAPKPAFVGRPASLGPIALGPATVAPVQESEFDRFYREMTELASAPAAVPTVAVSAMPVPTEVTAMPAPRLPETAVAELPRPLAEVPTAGSSPTRKAVLGAVKIMAAAVLIVLIGVVAMFVFSFQGALGPGELRTPAIVTSLGSTSGNGCAPVATFAVAGKSYATDPGASVSPCPMGLGESVNVVYSAANPASGARIEVDSSLAPYLWLVPILGGLVFLGGLVLFIVRAGSIAAGISLLRDRPRRTSAAVAAV